MRKSSINGPFSMAMLNNQRVHFKTQLGCVFGLSMVIWHFESGHLRLALLPEVPWGNRGNHSFIGSMEFIHCRQRQIDIDKMGVMGDAV